MYKFSCYLWNARIIILVQEEQEMNLMTAAVKLQRSGQNELFNPCRNEFFLLILYFTGHSSSTAAELELLFTKKTVRQLTNGF